MTPLLAGGPPPASMAVAVSGGRDSLALALLLREWAGARECRLLALTVDHALRPDSGEEAARVAAWMAGYGIAHRVLRWEGGKPATGLQEAARAARHRLLAAACRREGILHLCLAHQRDDQAETLLFRLAHGSGPDGLAGMTARRAGEDICLLRPLLGVPREALTATCLRFGQPWIDDPGNQGDRYARGRLRAASDARAALGLGDAALAETARRAAGVRRALDQRVAALLARHVRLLPEGYAEFDSAVAALEPESRRRLLAPLLAAVGGRDYPPQWEEVERLAADLPGLASSGRGATLGGCVLRRGGGRFVLAREAGRVAGPVPLEAAGPTRWDGRFVISMPVERGLGRVVDRGLMVAALGADAARQRLADGVVPAGVAKAALATLPALWRDGSLLALPHFGWLAPGAPEGVAAVTARFAPPAPVAGAGFFVA